MHERNPSAMPDSGSSRLTSYPLDPRFRSLYVRFVLAIVFALGILPEVFFFALGPSRRACFTVLLPTLGLVVVLSFFVSRVAMAFARRRFRPQQT